MVAGPAKEAAAGSSSLAITLFTTLEETLEMAGVVICIHALTTYQVTQAGGVELHLGALPGGNGRDDTGALPESGIAGIIKSLIRWPGRSAR